MLNVCICIKLLDGKAIMATYYYYNNRSNRTNESNSITAFMMLVLMMILLALGFAYAFDRSMDNKDTMLCNSAKVSGNLEYLEKCQCFYDGEDIKCLYK